MEVSGQLRPPVALFLQKVPVNPLCVSLSPSGRFEEEKKSLARAGYQGTDPRWSSPQSLYLSTISWFTVTHF